MRIQPPNLGKDWQTVDQHRQPVPQTTRRTFPCVVRDSNLGHQLLLPPAKWCPIFASRTTHYPACRRRPPLLVRAGSVFASVGSLDWNHPLPAAAAPARRDSLSWALSHRWSLKFELKFCGMSRTGSFLPLGTARKGSVLATKAV